MRRNNIEIHGIPDEENEDLESKVVAIADSIGINIHKTEIEACHRIKKGKKDSSSRTIIRFVNRKKCDILHQNKKNLKSKAAKEKLAKIGLNGNIFINCNLTPYTKSLWSLCKKLFDETN